MSDFTNDKTVTIRKPRKCYGCRRTFEKGTQMRVVSGVYDRSWFSYHACQTCIGIFQLTIYTGDGISEGCVLEWIDFKGQTPEQLLEQLKSKK